MLEIDPVRPPAFLPPEAEALFPAALLCQPQAVLLCQLQALPVWCQPYRERPAPPPIPALGWRPELSAVDSDGDAADGEVLLYSDA